MCHRSDPSTRRLNIAVAFVTTENVNYAPAAGRGILTPAVFARANLYENINDPLQSETDTTN